MRVQNIWLIGYMGAGKTTVAAELSKRLGMIHFDTDAVIQMHTKLSIPQIWAKYGEKHFRVLEAQFSHEVANSCPPCVISTGGGLPIHGYSIGQMKLSGPVIYLKADVETLWQRTQNGAERPLAHDYHSFVYEFLKRQSIYEESDFTVNANQSLTEVVSDILSILKNQIVNDTVE